MNKIILFSLCILSLNLFAQDEEPVYESEFAETSADVPETSLDTPKAGQTFETPLAAESVDFAPETPANTEQAAATPTTEEAPIITEEVPAAGSEEAPIVTEEAPAEPEKVFTETETPVMTTQVYKEPKKFDSRESHWLISLGLENLAYETPYEFEGIRKNFKPGTSDMYGARLGLGGEIHLGRGFMTSSRIEGYYVGTIFTKAKTANPEIDDLEFASSKKTGSVYGADAVQSISYVFDFKTKNPFMDEWSYLTFEPFIEIGLGMAKAYNRIKYNYDTASGGVSGGVLEGYRHTVEDDITNARIGGGFYMTSRQGYFFFLRATQNTYDVTNRKQRGAQNNAGVITSLSVPSTDKNVKIDPIMVYAIGGGYKF